MKSFSALCRSQVELSAAVDGADGRWLVNNGDAMEMTVDGLNVVKGRSRPIRCVIDLAQLKPARSTISALYNHETLIGHWSDIEIDPAKGIFQTLRLTRPANEMEAAVLAEAVMVGAHLRAKVPWQASIQACPRDDGRWEAVAAGQSVVVNGRTFTGDGEVPLYVLRNGDLIETSVCEFGADSRTGQIAAKKTTVTPSTKENPMSRIQLAATHSKGKPAALCAAILALCADEQVPEDQIGPRVAAMEMDDLKCRLTAAEEDAKKKDETIAALQAQVAAKAKAEEPKADDKTKDEAKAKAAASASSKGVSFTEKTDDVPSEAPKTRIAAQAAIKAKHPSKKGFEVVTAARREFSNYDALPIQ